MKLGKITKEIVKDDTKLGDTLLVFFGTFFLHGHVISCCMV